MRASRSHSRLGRNGRELLLGFSVLGCESVLPKKNPEVLTWGERYSVEIVAVCMAFAC
jgi:hypothetical protein